MLRFIEVTIRRKAIAFSGVREKQVGQNPVNMAQTVLQLPKGGRKREGRNFAQRRPQVVMPAWYTRKPPGWQDT